jgi:hypothetical protein
MILASWKALFPFMANLTAVFFKSKRQRAAVMKLAAVSRMIAHA